MIDGGETPTLLVFQVPHIPTHPVTHPSIHPSTYSVKSCISGPASGTGSGESKRGAQTSFLAVEGLFTLPQSPLKPQGQGLLTKLNDSCTTLASGFGAM